MINRRLRSKNVKRSLTLFVILSVALIPIFTSCGGQKRHEETVATVNGAPVLLKEFQKDLAIYANRNPDFKLDAKSVEDHLDMFIDKQLMIQEAMKMGLAEDERFLETIKRFWEQTLIRELIDAKSMEWRDKLFVTEDEIQSYYQEIKSGAISKPPLKDVHDEIKTSLLEQKKQKAMEEWLKEVRKDASIKIDAKKLSESYK
jgi:hypothetical protein